MSDLWMQANQNIRELYGYSPLGWIEDYTEFIKDVKIEFGKLCKKRKNEYKKYQQSEQWKELKKKVFKNNNGLCLDCGKKAECIHHEHYNLLYTSAEEFSCVPLCMICHMKRHDICESYNSNNIFVGKCYMCDKTKLITRVDSWSGKKLPDGSYLKGSWRNFCEDCVKKMGWKNNRNYNRCCKCFEEFVGSKKQSKCKECCGDGY
jgi:hypothetical protein